LREIGSGKRIIHRLLPANMVERTGCFAEQIGDESWDIEPFKLISRDFHCINQIH
jgi:hypothetical protein